MTVTRIGIDTAKGPSYAKAVVHNGTAYLAGQVAVNPAPTAREQTQQILSQIDSYLKACGTGKSNFSRRL